MPPSQNICFKSEVESLFAFPPSAFWVALANMDVSKTASPENSIPLKETLPTAFYLLGLFTTILQFWTSLPEPLQNKTRQLEKLLGLHVKSLTLHVAKEFSREARVIHNGISTGRTSSIFGLSNLDPNLFDDLLCDLQASAPEVSAYMSDLLIPASISVERLLNAADAACSYGLRDFGHDEGLCSILTVVHQWLALVYRNSNQCQMPSRANASDSKHT